MKKAMESLSHMIKYIDFRICFISLIPDHYTSYRAGVYYLLLRHKKIRRTVKRLEMYLRNCGDTPTAAEKKNIKNRLARLEIAIQNNSKTSIAIVFGRPQELASYLRPCYEYIQLDVPKINTKNFCSIGNVSTMNVAELRENRLYCAERLAMDAKKALDQLSGSINETLRTGAIHMDDHRIPLIMNKLDHIEKIVNALVQKFEEKKIEEVTEGEYVKAFAYTKAVFATVCDFIIRGNSPNDYAQQRQITEVTTHSQLLWIHLRDSAGFIFPDLKLK